MENKGLLFIPDISGFTRFVNGNDIEHSRVIIQELLEILINSNNTGLEISEIEGDAILFYKFGESPSLEAIYRQVEQMFCAFHSHLALYELRRFCQCSACKSAINLTLKVITHYGEFTGYNVKTFNKLIGKDIIVAHQLLKNDIDQHEYWLVTDSLLQNKMPEDLSGWMKWGSSIKQTDEGDIPFHYTQLSELKNGLNPSQVPDLKLAEKTKVISVSRSYDTAIIPLFRATGEFNYRNKWQEGLNAVWDINHILPMVGMQFRNVFDDKEVMMYASSFSFQPEKIEFSESDTKNQFTNFYSLEYESEQRTKLTIDFYIGKGFIKGLLFNLTKKTKMEAALKRSMEKLDKVVREVVLPA